ncbi:MAG: phospholipid/cholesterol/gamma-HCH transport system substrate-binding protein [Thermoleophilaceae bacterium]|nr:phospholipid/cholesterol/gamma-HCH transport system substrate-binding protein [Thermoleophilaceae bacterium]
MRGRGGGSALAASPVLVGAVTVLVTIVAVFLSYNANSGLPFVPTYDLKANLPNAAQLVKGFEVRIGGARVGVISEIVPKRRADGSTYARVTMKLDKQIEPLPVGSKLLVRPRSAVGLKYIEVEPGRRSANERTLAAGSTIPVRQVRTPVELDEFFNMFDERARVGSRNSLDGYGGGLAGRGQDLNSAIEALVPLLSDAEPVLRNLADPNTQLARFFRSLADTATQVAPVAEQQASLFIGLDRSFTALALVARPFIQETISESPPSEQVAIHDFPLQRPFLRNNAAFFKELRPGVATLPHSAPILADAFQAGTKVLPRTIPANEDLGDVFDSLASFSEDPLVRQGVNQLTRLSSSLRPTLRFLTPAQTVCNYATLWFRNAASLLSDGDTNGTWQRFQAVSAPTDTQALFRNAPLDDVYGPNNEGSPSSAPANGPQPINHLHYNPYPNTAAPGQTKECEAGNELYESGVTVIGNAKERTSTKTDGQVRSKASAAGVQP